jgi:phage shock protein E
MSGLAKIIKAGAKVVDVRTEEEFREEHYPDAVNIPVDQLQRRLADLGDKQAPIVLYCASGARSAYAAQMLRSAGYASVTNAGGLDDMPEFSSDYAVGG